MLEICLFSAKLKTQNGKKFHLDNVVIDIPQNEKFSPLKCLFCHLTSLGELQFV